MPWALVVVERKELELVPSELPVELQSPHIGKAKLVLVRGMRVPEKVAIHTIDIC